MFRMSQDQREEWLRGSRMQAMRAAREKLPAHTKRAQLLEALKQQRVVIVSGATGCGKSTQLPQYVLEQVNQPLLLVFSSPVIIVHHALQCLTGSHPTNGPPKQSLAPCIYYLEQSLLLQQSKV